MKIKLLVLFFTIFFGNIPAIFANQTLIKNGIEYNLFEDCTAAVTKIHYYSGAENQTIEIPSTIFDSYGICYIVTALGNGSIVFDHEWHNLSIEESSLQDEWYQDEWTLEQYPSKLNNISLPETLTRIGKLALAGCNGLNSIYIPETVSFVDSCAFIGCNNLKEVHTPNLRKWKEINFVGTGWDCRANPLFYSHQLYEAGMKVTDIQLITSWIHNIGDYAFHGWDGTTASFDVGVERLGVGAFSSCQNLESIAIQSHFVDSISSLCFNNCTNLKYIDLPKSLKKIGSFAFQCCSSLANIDLPESVTTVDRHAFSHCYALEDIHLPTGIAAINDGVFINCHSLNNVNIPALVTKIGEESFYGCNSLSEIIVPANVLTIERAAFNDCQNLRLITFADSPSELTYNVDVRTSPWGDLTLFGNSPIEQIYLGRNISESLRNSLCNLSTLKLLHFGEGANEILPEMYGNCEALEEISFSPAMRLIGAKAFINANNLRKIVIEAAAPPIVSEDSFSPEVYANAELLVPAASLNIYKEAPIWQNFYKISANLPTSLTNNFIDSGVSIKILNGSVVVNGATNVKIYSYTGEEIYSGGSNIFQLPTGLYVILADSITRKIRI